MSGGITHTSPGKQHVLLSHPKGILQRSPWDLREKHFYFPEAIFTFSKACFTFPPHAKGSPLSEQD